MSRIYDALIRAGRNPESRSIFSERPKEGEAGYHNNWWRTASLNWQIFAIVATVTGVFGVAVAVSVYLFVNRALRSEIDQRGRVLATALSDAAAAYVAAKNVLELDALIAKFSRLEGVAYVVIENANGDVVIDSSRGILSEYQRPRDHLGREQTGILISDAAGRGVYEYRASILEGQLGAARIAVWEEGVTTQIDATLFPVIATILLLILTSIVLNFFLLRLLVGRHFALSARTNDIRTADLDSPISNGAIG
jgi:sensor histidine kinase regulating citrate/malate metabolism